MGIWGQGIWGQGIWGQGIWGQSKNTVWHADYQPFGKTDITVDNLTFNLRFPGQYHDAETGLNYNYFRSYNPATGRYTQSDPIGLRGGLNRFAYTGANPINAFDMYGLVKWSGTFQLKSAGVGKIGYQWGTYDLESECDYDDKKAFVTVEVSQWTMGGSPLVGSDIEGKIELIDGKLRVSRGTFEGHYEMNSIGIQLGSFGIGSMSTYIGESVGTEENDVSGLDIGFGFGVRGEARVIRYKEEQCNCN